MELKRQAHGVYRTMYHIVWIPRYRYDVFTNGVDHSLISLLDEVQRHSPEVEYSERNIQPDHVHLVISFPPKYAIAKVVQIIKSNTGNALKDKFEFLQRRYYGAGGMWSAG